MKAQITFEDIMKKLILIFSVIALTGCCNKNYPIAIRTDSTTSITHYIPRDTLIRIPADSAYIKMLLKCDSTGKVLLQQLYVLKNGQLIEAQAELEDNTVIVTANTKKNAAIPATITDKETTTNTKRTETYLVEVPRQKNWYEKLMHTSGQIAWGLLIITTAILYFKKK